MFLLATKIGGFMLAIVLTLAMAANDAGQPPEKDKSETAAPPTETEVARPTTTLPDAKSPATTRLREGVELADRVGQFKLRGDRATFISTDGGLSLVGLENLNLERVVRAISDNPNQDWRVSGIVTEFRGGNYLLITRAIMLNKPANRASNAPAQ
jgi:hypothetical protein